MKKSNVLLTIALSIILSIVIVSLVNVGLSIFVEQPQWSNYCTHVGVPGEEYDYTACQASFDAADRMYNQTRFYTFAGVGVVLVLMGLFLTNPVIRWTGLLSGGVLLGEGVVLNFADKEAVFVTLLVVLVLIGIGVRRVVKKEFGRK